MIQFSLIQHNTIKISTKHTIILRELVNRYSFNKFRPDRTGKIRRYVETAITVLGTFQLGLMFNVLKDTKIIINDCIQTGKLTKPPRIEIDPNILKSLVPFRNFTSAIPVDLPNPDFKYFDDQHQIIEKLLKFGRGIIVSPCSSGKSAIIGGFIHSVLSTPQLNDLISGIILIVVPTRQLVAQLYKDMIDYGITDVSEFTSGAENKLASKIIISNRQWLNLHNTELPDVSMLISDEVQTVSQNAVSSRFIRKIKTSLKVGFTATLPTDDYTRFLIRGIFGEILINTKYLDLKRLHENFKISIKAVEFKFKTFKPEIRNLYKTGEATLLSKKVNPSEKFRNEIEYFYINNGNFVVHEIMKMVMALPGNTLVLFDFLKIRDKIRDFVGYSERIHWIDGSVKIKEREDIRTVLEDKSDQILIGQIQTMGVGINIKNINNIVFMFTSKIQERIVQTIGRGVRQKDGKTELNVFDITSNLKYFKRHFNKRCEIYEQNFGIMPEPYKQIEIN